MNTTAIIEQYISEALAGKAINTAKAYRHSLIKFAEYLDGSGTDLAGYGRVDVQQYIAYLQGKQRSASGVNREIAAVKSYSIYAGKPDTIEGLRMTKAPRHTQEAPEWLERTKVNELLRTADRKTNKRDYAIIMTLLGCGLRVSELAALDRGDVDISERKGVLYVRSGKGDVARTISIPAETRQAITLYLSQRSDDLQALFTSQLNKRISVRSIQAMLNEYEINPHQLRHTFIKRLVDNNTPVATIQSLTGHSSVEMIAWYSQPSADDKQAAVDAIF